MVALVEDVLEGEALAAGGRSGCRSCRSCQGRLLRRRGVCAKGRYLPSPLLLLLSHLMPMISKGIVAAAAAAAIEVVIAHLMVVMILVVAVLLLLKLLKYFQPIFPRSSREVTSSVYFRLLVREILYSVQGQMFLFKKHKFTVSMNTYNKSKMRQI